MAEGQRAGEEGRKGRAAQGAPCGEHRVLGAACAHTVQASTDSACMEGE